MLSTKTRKKLAFGANCVIWPVSMFCIITLLAGIEKKFQPMSAIGAFIVAGASSFVITHPLRDYHSGEK